jgi:hypothetical protein
MGMGQAIGASMSLAFRKEFTRSWRFSQCHRSGWGKYIINTHLLNMGYVNLFAARMEIGWQKQELVWTCQTSWCFWLNS